MKIKKLLTYFIALILSFILTYTVFKVFNRGFDESTFLIFSSILFILIIYSIKYVKYGTITGNLDLDNEDLQKFKYVIDQLQEKNILSIPLENISEIWVEKKKNSKQNKVIEVGMDKIYSIWRDDYVITIQTAPEKTFMHDETKKFFARLQQIFKNELEKNKKTTEHQQEFYIEYRIILFLLRNLDLEGHCPSVVSNFNDKENRFRPSEPDFIKINKRKDDIKSDYELLRNSVNLLQHSIHVADNIIDIITKKKKNELYRNTMLPAAIIAALAHDIGKEPKLYNAKDYVTRVHPEISALFLERLFNNPDFKPNERVKEEKMEIILFAVKNHHVKTIDKSETDLGKIQLLDKLKEADHIARVNEKNEALIKLDITPSDEKQANVIDENIKAAGQIENKLDAINEFNKKLEEKKKQSALKKKESENSKISRPTAKSNNTHSTQEDTALIFQYKNFEEALLFKPADAMDKVKFVKKDYACDWLNDDTVNEMLNLIDERVNYVKYYNQQPIYDMFTIKDVLFLTGRVGWALIYYFAKLNNDIEVMNADKNMRRNLIRSLIDKLVNMELVNVTEKRMQYFGGNFILESKKYNDLESNYIRAFLLPLNLHKFAAIFEKTPAEYELRKKDKKYDEYGFLQTLINYKWNTEKS